MSIASIPCMLREEARTRKPNEPCLSRFIDLELTDLKSLGLWRGAMAEFIGCLFLNMFTIKFGMVAGVTHLQVALGCGFFFAVIITALSTVSGGHVNPAVSIGFLVTGHITVVRFIVYTVFQTCGGLTGVALLKVVIPESMHGNLGIIKIGKECTLGMAVGSEIYVTFFLMFVVMAMIDSGRKDVQGSIPFMVGLTVTINIFYGETLSGGIMNPVRNFAPALIKGDLENIWVYWVGPMIGGVIGSLTYDLVFATSPGTLWRKYRRGAIQDYEHPKGEEAEGKVYKKMLTKKKDYNSHESNI
ncbi:aquaporin-like [Physella acuta]|uniref:aquaporin-like n=1 Tax=Physella acuta TaxID=109671 RepID=UPI0027DCC3D9|nr:aquaporin-like [Physella acuta]XP_059149038.1 aquaporin-like [Physella acuta]